MIVEIEQLTEKDFVQGSLSYEYNFHISIWNESTRVEISNKQGIDNISILPIIKSVLVSNCANFSVLRCYAVK